MKTLPHSENEMYLIEEQNRIKAYLDCVAVYNLPIGERDIPEGFLPDITAETASVFTTKYNKDPKLREYKLFYFNEK